MNVFGTFSESKLGNRPEAGGVCPIRRLKALVWFWIIDET
jgi:hypothetical protein